MENLYHFLQLGFQIGTYHLSLLEILLVFFSLSSVYLSRLGWAMTLLAQVCFFLFFHQIQLYALMAAQVILFLFTLIWRIRYTSNPEAPVRKLDSTGVIISIMATVMPSISLMIALQQIPAYFPQYFPLPATFTFMDALLAVGSIVAMLLLTWQYIDAWVCWMVIHGLLAFILGWKECYLAMLGQMVLLTYAAKEYLMWRSLSKN
jgi:nicotinamide mononucleotide transporter